MATNVYMTSRRKYQRPQAMLWANNPGTLSNGFYIPNGFEIGQNPENAEETDLLNEFLVLSDDNREAIDFQPLRIERRERMINGRMRSYHIADKLTISTSWSMLPSRSFESYPNFDFETAQPDTFAGEQYTTDGGAGGVEILDWYSSHQDSFWVYLAYDKYSNFEDEDEKKYARLAQYNQILEVYIADFNYSVVKRGGSNYDFWNIAVTLEEV
jgi:hypothetical protein